MDASFEWYPGLFSIDTAEFDRALNQLRQEKPPQSREPARIRELADRLKAQSGISQREFDRRFRLTIATIAENDSSTLQAIAAHLRENSPQALNALRTLLPAELRHLAIQRGPTAQGQALAPPTPTPSAPSKLVPSRSDSDDPTKFGQYAAVALIGTTEEHVRNHTLLENHNLHPYRVPTLDQLWDLAKTGLCGFVIGGSVWRQIEASEHPRNLRLICEYSTFLFTRICLEGLSETVARTFAQHASDARCGIPDARRFCHGQDCNLTSSDIAVLQEAAGFLVAAGTVDFFPLGLSEADASLLRLIAEQRRPPDRPVTIRRLGTRELPGGRSGARVFLLNDGSSQAFVAKVGDAEELGKEVRRYQQWIANWEHTITSPTFHSHLKSAAITYRLQPAPDAQSDPAPTLEECLQKLRLAEWTKSLEDCGNAADDLFLAIERIINRLVELNSQKSGHALPNDEFWFHWPVRDLAERGIEFRLVDKYWQNIDLWELVKKSLECVKPSQSRGIIHGDIHGRNILLIDRIPAFIDFAMSGPGHPLSDLVRIDAVVRTSSMRMLLNKQSMQDLFHSIYIDGTDVEQVLAQHPSVAISPLAKLSIRTAAKVRDAANSVCHAHGIDFLEFYAMHCIVSAHILVNQNPGSGIERLMLSVIGSRFLADYVAV